MTFAQQLALWADKLRDMSAMGLLFSKDPYDRERYRALQDISLEMLATAGGQAPEELEPLRGTLFTTPTPLTGGEGAVIDAEGRLLLVRRADNGLWALPGGAMAVGETPAEGVMREVLEETGVCCTPVALVGLYDSRRCNMRSRFHLYLFIFLCRPVPGASVAPSHPQEILEQGWFREDELPSTIDPGHVTRIPDAFRCWRGGGQAYFDADA